MKYTKSAFNINKIDLPTKVINALAKAGHTNLIELEGITLNTLTNVKGLGHKGIMKLIDILRDYKVEIVDVENWQRRLKRSARKA